MPIRYIRADLTELSDKLAGEKFDLILDYKVAHHLAAAKLKEYVAQCLDILKPGGRLLLICYSDKDTDAAGHNAAIGKFGNEMFYRSAGEIRNIYKTFKEVGYQEVMLGKRLNHAGHKFVFEK